MFFKKIYEKENEYFKKLDIENCGYSIFDIINSYVENFLSEKATFDTKETKIIRYITLYNYFYFNFITFILNKIKCKYLSQFLSELNSNDFLNLDIKKPKYNIGFIDANSHMQCCKVTEYTLFKKYLNNGVNEKTLKEVNADIKKFNTLKQLLTPQLEKIFQNKLLLYTNEYYYRKICHLHFIYKYENTEIYSNDSNLDFYEFVLSNKDAFFDYANEECSYWHSILSNTVNSLKDDFEFYDYIETSIEALQKKLYLYPDAYANDLLLNYAYSFFDVGCECFMEIQGK